MSKKPAIVLLSGGLDSATVLAIATADGFACHALSFDYRQRHKQELDAEFLTHADLIVADSVSQCLERGEIHKAMQQGAIDAGPLVELGKVIAGDAKGRTSDDQLTIADLTGVAVQDIQITKAVYETLA